MKKIINLIIRLLISPLILALLIIAHIRGLIITFAKFMFYGGEWVTFNKKADKTLQEIYNKVVEETENDTNTM